MIVRSKVKKNARKAVMEQQHFIKAACITLILFCVWLFFSLLVLGANAATEAFQLPSDTMRFVNDWKYIFSPIVVAVTFLLELILFSPLILGTAKWFFNLISEENCEVIDLFDFFTRAKNYFGSIWMEINIAVRSVFYTLFMTAVPITVIGFGVFLSDGSYTELPSRISVLVGSMLFLAGFVLLIAAIIFAWIFTKRYFLARYLYAEGGCSVLQAIKYSVRFMKGHKAELFLFDLSFLGWFLICIVIIPLIFVKPYYQSSSALYAKIIIESGRNAIGDKEGATPTLEDEVNNEIQDNENLM